MSPYMRRNLEEAAQVAREHAKPELDFLRESFRRRTKVREELAKQPDPLTRTGGKS